MNYAQLEDSHKKHHHTVAHLELNSLQKKERDLANLQSFGPPSAYEVSQPN